MMGADTANPAQQTAESSDEEGTSTEADPLAPFVCDYWIAPSLQPNSGRGIISGRNYEGGESFGTINPALSVNWMALYELPGYPLALANYCYAAEDENHAMSVQGIAMLINHNPTPKLEG